MLDFRFQLIGMIRVLFMVSSELTLRNGVLASVCPPDRLLDPPRESVEYAQTSIVFHAGIYLTSVLDFTVDIFAILLHRMKLAQTVHDIALLL